ncbi:MAG: DUF4129 domain-containing protein [Acidimicrobiales bacterium]
MRHEGGHDPEQVRASAEAILARRQYEQPGPNRISDAIGWVLDHLFPGSLRSSIGGGPGFVGDLVLVALVVGVAYLIYRLVRGWRPRSNAEEIEALLTIELEERRSGDEWSELAERLMAAGRFREALRARYGELVARLADDGSVATVAGRTSGEYRVDVGLTRPAGASAFEEASSLFERVWYGGNEASAADVGRLHAVGVAVLESPKARLETESAGAVR